MHFLLLRTVMKQIGLIALLFVVSNSLFAQVKQFDKLEMLYAQGHFRRVYRKSNLLIDKPEFDYSMMPKYYKSISLLQLIQNDYWLKNHKEAIDEARSLFFEVKSSNDAQALFNAHMYELSWLKNDMRSWIADLKRRGKTEEFIAGQKLIDEIFSGIDIIVVSGESNEFQMDTVATSSSTPVSNSRIAVIREAEKHLGTPYVWAGNTPEGFDCSGFTSYVFQQQGVELPRRSEDQYQKSTKVKAKNVQQGDLVFFNNGSGVSHVGIVISKKGEPIVMIHSSSSKGIIITEIDKSEYWTNRIYGYGTFIR